MANKMMMNQAVDATLAADDIIRILFERVETV